MEHSLITQAPTMTSREIAELTGKEHKNVLRDIRVMLVEIYGAEHLTQILPEQYRNRHSEYVRENADALLSAICGDGSERSHQDRRGFSWERDARGYVSVFSLDKTHTMTLISGYSVTLRHRIVKRWQELEEANVSPAWQIPTTLSGALRLAAEQAQKLEEQQAQIEAAKPAVEFVGRFVEAKSSKCLSDVAKLLGWKPQSFIARLSADAVIFKRGGSWLPFQAHLDAGRFTVKTGESQGHAFQQTRVTPSGVAWLASRYPATVEAKA